MWDTMWPYIAALLPTIVAVYIFYRIIKAIFEADRSERIAMRQWEEEHHIDLRSGQSKPPTTSSPQD